MPESISFDSIGNKGLNSDVAPWSLPPEYITSGKNFRIYAGSIRAAGGSADWAIAPSMFNPGHVQSVGSTTGDWWVVLGRAKVYAFDGNIGWNDISSTAGYAALGVDDELKWTSCMLAQIPVYNNPQTRPEAWLSQDGVSKLVPLQWDAVDTWETKGITCEVMRSHKNFLVAMDLTEGSTHYPNVVRVSTAADINGMPYTWDEADKAGLAVRFQLGGDGGRIVDGLSLRDNFVVYSERSIDIITYTGGEFVWSKRELSNTVGLLTKNGIAEVKGTHFFFGDGDIYSNDGTQIQSILYGRIKDQFTSRVNADYYHKAFIVKNETFKEIWFCVPLDDAEHPNVAYIFNWHDNSWVVRELPYSFDRATGTLIEGLTYAGYGSQTSPSTTWDGLKGKWDAQTQIWGGRTLSPLDSTIVGVIGNTSQLKILDPTGGLIDSDFSPAKISRTDFPLGGHQKTTTITRVYPFMSGDSPVSIQFGAQDFPGGPIRWKPAVIFNPDTERKIDIRVTGELFCWEVVSVDTGIPGAGRWELTGFLFEFEAAGVR